MRDERNVEVLAASGGCVWSGLEVSGSGLEVFGSFFEVFGSLLELFGGF